MPNKLASCLAPSQSAVLFVDMHTGRRSKKTVGLVRIQEPACASDAGHGGVLQSGLRLELGPRGVLGGTKVSTTS